MGPEKFFSSGMWIIPVVMMILCFLFFRFGMGKMFGGKGRFMNESSSDSQEESALDILKKRYAKGEITKEEFEDMKNSL